MAGKVSFQGKEPATPAHYLVARTKSIILRSRTREGTKTYTPTAVSAMRLPVYIYNIMHFICTKLTLFTMPVIDTRFVICLTGIYAHPGSLRHSWYVCLWSLLYVFILLVTLFCLYLLYWVCCIDVCDKHSGCRHGLQTLKPRALRHPVEGKRARMQIFQATYA